MISSATYTVATIQKEQITAPLLKIAVPGSKSITNRALLLATLAQGKSRLTGAIFSEDATYFQSCIKELGFETIIDKEQCSVTVTGLGGAVPKKEASIYVGSAGTAARFLTAYLGMSNGTYHLDSSEQMKKRPMAPLISGIKQLGCTVAFEEKENFFPFTLQSCGIGVDSVSVNIDNSSQFLSALLISGILSTKDFKIQVEGTHGMGYIEMTVNMMKQFGVSVKHPTEDTYIIPAGQTYQAMEYAIEPDVSAACYFYACAPLLHIPVQVPGVHKDSLQGDLAFLDVCVQMGCHYEDTPEGIILYPPATDSFPGVDVDMHAFSDQAITLSALAPFASSPTTIRGIGHIRLQESDRLSGIAKELTKMGIQVEEGKDYITIYPGTPKASQVETYDDHRMAMGFALVGLRAEGITILNPGCCKKTFADFFEVLESAMESITR